MRISSILIENFKSINYIQVSNLPNLVVVGGENGVGKTSLFEAIAFAKSSIASYTDRESDLWSQKSSSLVKVGQATMRVELEFEATTEAESLIMQNNQIAASVRYSTVGNTTGLRVDAPPQLRKMLGSWRKDTTEFGGFEFIPSNRSFTEGPLELQYRQQRGEEFLIRRISQMQNKFHDAKQNFANFQLHDLVFRDDPPIFDGIRNLVEELIGRKVTVNFVKPSMTPKILIELEDGSIDIDSLSSGQRELFMTFVSLQSLSLSNSVILFDEPDLHLHATLQKKVLNFLNRMTKTGNQIFIATHSLEMISETPIENLYRLHSYNGGSQLENVQYDKKK